MKQGNTTGMACCKYNCTTITCPTFTDQQLWGRTGKLCFPVFSTSSSKADMNVQVPLFRLIKGGNVFSFVLYQIPSRWEMWFSREDNSDDRSPQKLSISTWSSKFILPYCFYVYLGSTVRGHVKTRNYLLIEIIFSYFPSFLSRTPSHCYLFRSIYCPDLTIDWF